MRRIGSEKGSEHMCLNLRADALLWGLTVSPFILPSAFNNLNLLLSLTFRSVIDSPCVETSMSVTQRCIHTDRSGEEMMGGGAPRTAAFRILSEICNIQEGKSCGKYEGRVLGSSDDKFDLLLSHELKRGSVTEGAEWKGSSGGK